MFPSRRFENKAAIIALGVAGSLLLLSTVVATLLYRSREKIQVFLFNRYGFRFRREDERHDGKKYDAFVSFSQKDVRFVTRELVPELEQRAPHYQLCLHYRDWPVGGGIAQTICESVEQSRRTIILLSEDFLRSEWCQYEFKAAHYRVLHDKTIRLIVVLLDDRPPRDLDPELKLYIETNTYLARRDPWFWRKLRYVLPDVDREARPGGDAYFRYMEGQGAGQGAVGVEVGLENGGFEPEHNTTSDSESDSDSDNVSRIEMEGEADTEV